MNLLFVCFVALIGSAVADVSGENSKPTYVIIAEDGYPVEVHNVTTEDGYRLQMHRIPGPGRPVFLMHGLFCSSSDWIISGPKKALAYLLSDAGYDVWLGNARGNTYSKDMSNMTYSQKRNYWNFTWHEVGYYDLPIMIDFVLAKSDYLELFYIGHSQGTTAFFVLMSTKPEYNDNIIAMFAIAPVVYLKYTSSTVIKLASFPLLDNLVEAHEILPNDKLITTLADDLCRDGALTQDVCSNVVMAGFGVSRGQLNTTMLPVILGHVPAGASNRQLVHYGQIYRFGNFQRYDYGLLNNMAIYKSPIPPKYNLDKVTAPVYPYCGPADIVSNEKDVDRLITEISNPMKKTVISNPNWAHYDFICGKDAKTEVYDLIMYTMKEDYPD